MTDEIPASVPPGGEVVLGIPGRTRELRSWRWLPDRTFDERVALIRRTWQENDPMPGPPAPVAPGEVDR